ncbi:hypothetical protein Gotri_002496 [Gossypium trilobum]|uniref:Reverse transcriptase n=1 Tax=Gossypium trilobum TaxID=34281 RepID=A0A7J9F8H6_9ROSI|nr:hypothetical protein [Gossypium trilobum]
MEEIGSALKEMGVTKASRVDGLSAIFYQKFWHIIGQDVGMFCLNILNRGTSLEALNLTRIILISKKVLDVCVDVSHNAFILGQLITNNVLLAYEILNTFKHRRTWQKGFIALKLYMRKTFDRVEEAGEVFKPTKGLRQGDPLSPYLFLLWSEGLSLLMGVEQRGEILNSVKKEGCILCRTFWTNIATVQGWILISNPNSLLAHTLKAKNYPDSSFLEARLETHPSYTRKSILVAKSLLNEGGPVSDANLQSVTNLIDPNTRLWKEELINSTFDVVNVERILSIPLAQKSHDDKIAFTITRGTRNRKIYDETPSDDKEQDVTFENLVGIVNYLYQQLNEVRDTFKVNLTKCRTELQENINELANQIQMQTQVVGRLETSSN